MSEKLISKAIKLIRKGYSKEKILKKLRPKRGVLSPEDIYEVARCRIKAKEKFGELADKLYFDEIGLRYSTPKIVAEYRADRLKCDTIADVSCGVGAQLIFFAMRCSKAYGVEIDRKRALFAKLNAKSLGLKNVEIIRGDALNGKIVEKIRADIVFSDPARPPEEEVRTLESLQPNPILIHEKYSRVTENIAFELPPQMPPERIPLEGEKEYTSLNFKLNRLALYMGGLAECEVSAISLPSRERITDLDESIKPEKTTKFESFLYEVDPTIMKAGLLPNLLGKLDFNARVIYSDKRRTLLSSDEVVNSAFLRRYSILNVVKFEISTIKNALKELNAAKVTLRFSLDPSEYWSVRKKLEEGLSGERWVYLFRIDEYAVIAEMEGSKF
jgi:16S rRNA G966 N2-methylase RsmD